MENYVYFVEVNVRLWTSQNKDAKYLTLDRCRRLYYLLFETKSQCQMSMNSVLALMRPKFNI